MDEQENQDFTFGDEPHIEEEFSADLSERRIAKLSQKVTLLTLLIPCLFALIIGFLYFDITDKVGKVNSSGTAKVAEITKAVEAQLNELKTGSQAIQKELETNIKSLKSTTKALQGQYKKANRRISKLETSAKKEQKNTKAAIENLKKLTPALRADIDTLTKQNNNLLAIAETLEQKIQGIEQLKNSVKNLEAELMKQNGAFISQEDLNNRFKKEKRLFQLEIDRFATRINKQIALLKGSRSTTTTQGNTGKNPVN